ncbi:MAG: iron-regulated protein [Proteobacteria bacterium]|nr:iron-regulated protein [Pseudomonadota bacterium]
MKKCLVAVLSLAVYCASIASVPAADISGKAQVETYAKLVYANYQDAYADAKKLQKAVDALLANPNDATLKAAKDAWLASRNSYGQTEAFRFYEGPIDFVSQDKKEEGPEGRLNAWPLNEAYIDYVQGNPKSGIIQDEKIKISEAVLKEKNQADDEANVSTGYHAIEFLLWGQDLSADGPGNRPSSDYAKGDKIKERRREYLKAVTDILVEDLDFLVTSWEPNKDNYAKKFIAADPKESLGKIMTGLATLSGFELSSERMATALDSGDQEDEHSCFSDNTHNDFIYNAEGIENVYTGHYGSVKGAGIDALLAAKDKALADKLTAQIAETKKLIASLPVPIDTKVLASPKDSEGRKKMEAAVVSLQKEADLLKQAGRVLGVKADIVSE